MAETENPLRVSTALTMAVQAAASQKEADMQLNGEQRRLLQWIEAKEPVLGVFHVMTDLAPMIREGLVESRPVPRAKGQLVITEAGKAALTTTH